MATQIKSKKSKAQKAKAKTSPKTSAPSAKKQSLLRRSALAYVGLYGLAYDRAMMRFDQARDLTDTLFDELVEKGELIEAKTNARFKVAQTDAIKQYEATSKSLAKLNPLNLLPGKVEPLVEELEDEVAQLGKKLKALKKSAPAQSKTKSKKKSKSKTKSKTTTERTVKKPSVKKPAVKKPVTATPVQATVETSVPVKKTAEVSPVQTPAVSMPVTAVKEEPRHIPYFNDVKRYDPFANEDLIRKIVNHCGIALRSEDARYVACSDETERNRVRDSWMKKKLGLEGTDTDLDKSVQNVCSIMQRDTRKNRVTFYYLIAKSAKKLDTL